ncbi:ArnT family glycosyltransferase [Polyangium fumosum]|uniref:Phospholipid carrier-dependent glycosyltransferase n=1 Tax=Polyangium fumosum TaxID=889272 RepID=A0A4U1IAQ8_9BACT|nr:glycosyltransferase family 39 protein [Polyangium fumosum]TKC90537.1 phospholipid carrier-dependent glycosyltransferase [Polyangium fumosum]
MSGVKLTWKDDLVAALLAGVVMAVLVATVGDLGYARDEGFYFHAADSYRRWFELLFANPRAAFEPKAIDNAWRVNSEHPGLIKSLFALSNLFLQKKLHLFAMEGTSYRFPGIFLAGAGVGLVYRWGAEARGRIAGLFAAIALFCMPRFFYHAHLACFDVPVVTMFLLATYCFWKAMREGGSRWPIAAGLAFGLALDTKHNAWFLPILAVTFVALCLVRDRLTGGDVKETARRALATLGAMAVLGPLVMYALWPWIWRDTFARLGAYASFHLNHEYYNMEFLGRTYWTPPMPRLYAPVMTAATVPAVTLALFALGLGVRARARIQALLRARAGKIARREGGETDLLWLMAIGISYGAWVLPKTPIFGGTKHWMQAYPFLALFAGAGVSWLVSVLRGELRRLKGANLRRFARGPAAAMALFVVLLAAPIAETAGSHPWGLSNYTPLVGGAKGAATLGLNRTFWGYTTGAVVEYLNHEVPKGGTVYVHDTAWPSWEMLQKDGRLRKDIRGVGAVHEADFALYHHEPHMLGQEYQAWVAYGTVQPAHVAGLHGTPVIWIYRRKGR